jgi:hypothetical protein
LIAAELGTMRSLKFLLSLILLIAAGPRPAPAAVKADLSAFQRVAGFEASQSGDILTVDWAGESGRSLRLRLNLGSAEQLIAELSHAESSDAPRKLILKDATPAYWVYIGRRHGAWEDSYFDNPSQRPHEISTHYSKLTIQGCRVESDGKSLRIVVPGLWMGLFHGDLVFTLYAGSNLVKQEAVMSSQEPNLAYYYDAWLRAVRPVN